MHWYLEVLRKYATFSGRARRKEYWMFALINILIMLGLTIVEGTSGVTDGGVLSALYSLAVVIPSIAVTVRRLHDTGRSGWWILLPLIPVLGAFVLLVFTCLDSEPDTNRYGANPKTSSSA